MKHKTFFAIADEKGRNIFTDVSAAYFFGFRPYQLLGDGWLYIIHPRDRLRAKFKWQQSVKTRLPYNECYRCRRHDGSYHWLDVHGERITLFNLPRMHWIITFTHSVRPGAQTHSEGAAQA